LLVAGMVGVDLPSRLPERFVELRQSYSRQPAAAAFLDEDSAPVPAERRAEVSAATDETIRQVREMVFPLHGL
jgi:hypothetical protein